MTLLHVATTEVPQSSYDSASESIENTTQDQSLSSKLRTTFSDEQLASLRPAARRRFLTLYVQYGPACVPDIARYAGATASSAYHNTRALLNVGILRVHHTETQGPNETVYYESTFKNYGFKAEGASPTQRQMIADIISSDMRLAQRLILAQLKERDRIPAGPKSDLRTISTSGWLDSEDLTQLNYHLDKIYEIMSQQKKKEESRKHIRVFAGSMAVNW